MTTTTIAGVHGIQAEHLLFLQLCMAGRADLCASTQVTNRADKQIHWRLTSLSSSESLASLRKYGKTVCTLEA